MSRISEGPRYYRSKGAWFANINHQRVKLVAGPKKATEAVAKDNYRKLAQLRAAEVEGDRAPVRAILNAYIGHATARSQPAPLSGNSLKILNYAVTCFCDYDEIGEKPVGDLRRRHFDEWVNARRQPWSHPKQKRTYRGWNDNTVRMILAQLHTAFVWAANEGDLISVNPMARRSKRSWYLTTNTKERRLAITDPEHTALLEIARRRKHKDFYVLLQLLYATGARPAELHGAKAEEWSDTLQAFVIQPTKENRGRFKLARHGKKRTLRIPEELVPLVRGQIQKYRTRPLFRNERGKPWDARSFAGRFAICVGSANRKSIKQGGEPVVRTEVTGYSYRHAFATRWLMGRSDIQVLCELLNTSIAMLQRHYSHLFEQHDTLRNALNSFNTGGANQSQPSLSDGAAAVLTIQVAAGAQ
jgi:integrase